MDVWISSLIHTKDFSVYFYLAEMITLKPPWVIYLVKSLTTSLTWPARKDKDLADIFDRIQHCPMFTFEAGLLVYFFESVMYDF